MCALAVLATSSTGSGAPIIVGFQGTITSSSDNIVLSTLSITLSDTLAGAYTFESATTDSEPADPLTGIYNGAMSSLTATIGGNTWTLGPTNRIVVLNDDDV